LAILAVLAMSLFIYGIWNVVFYAQQYGTVVLSLCSVPLVFLVAMTLVLAGSGAYLVNIYMNRREINDLALGIFVAVLLLYTVSLYLVAYQSSYGAYC
jgi:hypothetical protein